MGTLELVTESEIVLEATEILAKHAYTVEALESKARVLWRNEETLRSHHVCPSRVFR
jgi:hypothetical protein